jgi:hypothetical protein
MAKSKSKQKSAKKSAANASPSKATSVKGKSTAAKPAANAPKKADLKAAAPKPVEKNAPAKTDSRAASNPAPAAPQKPITQSPNPKPKPVEKEAAPAKAPPPPPQENPQLPATGGKVNIFGGPKDRGVKPDDKLALPTGQHFVYERFRSLHPQSFYCSMRWQYTVLHMTPEEVKRWWANRKIQITNPKTGVSVVARAVDWGPHENTGLDVGISPGAASALGVEAGDEVQVAMADPKSPLGIVREDG